MILEFREHLLNSRNSTLVNNVHARNRFDERHDAEFMTLLHQGGAYLPDGVVDACTRHVGPVYSSRHGSTLTFHSSTRVTANEMKMIDAAAKFLEKRGLEIQVRLYYVPVLGSKKTRSMSLLSPIDINSGVTMFTAPNESVVLVYRRQEAIKVILHELIHAYALDYSGSKKWSTTGKALAKKWNVLSRVEVRLNEAYVELMASFLYSELSSRHSPNSKSVKILDMSQHFLNQAEKIICITAAQGKFDQMTHAFEYYIVKAAPFFDNSIEQVKAVMNSGNSDAILNMFVDSTNKYMSQAACRLGMTSL